MFDVLTTGAVVDELRRTILDGRIQRLGMVDQLTVAMEIYAQGKRWHLIASADAENPRVHLVDAMPSTDPNTVTPFSLQMRKYARGGYITDIVQPPLERIVVLSIAKRMSAAAAPGPPSSDVAPGFSPGVHGDLSGDNDEFEDDDIWSGENVSRLELAIEIMGRHSNLVLVDEEGIVRESAKRVNASMSRVRQIQPRKPYAFPPVPEKPDPRQVTSATIEQLLATGKPGDVFATSLVRGFRSVSPQTAREVAFRATDSVETTLGSISRDQAPEIARIVRNLYQPLLTGAWLPHLYLRDELPIGYGALPMQHLAVDAEEQAVASISAAIESAQMASGHDTPKDHAQRRAQLVQNIDRALQSVNTRLHSLNQQYERSHEVERLRRWGDAIYAYLWQIQPGDTELVAETEAGEERIPLDPEKDPKTVAAEYFEDYRKSQKAGEQLPERIAAADAERQYLEQLRWQANEAEGFAAIEDVRKEFEDIGGSGVNPRGSAQRSPGVNPRGAKGASGKSSSSRRVTPLTDSDGNLYYIGRSSKENEHVTFEIASAGDWWFHARGVPGSHVILRTRIPTDEPAQELIERAARLAAWYSQKRDSGNVEVDVTQRRHVRKIHGAGPGMVTYRNEYTILVSAADEKMLGLE
ncbi:MAG: NFACT family protein [Thermomicrobiales bacterium]|nr:NFACT family protein [Thermomicrobiales bacterium]